MTHPLRLMLTAAMMAAALFTAPAQADIRLAYVDPLSGSFANVGEALLINLKEIVRGVNERGGVLGERLEIVPFDNKSSPQETLIQLKAVTDQGIRYVMQGQGSGAALALVDAVNKWNARNPDKTVLFLDYAAVDPELTNQKCSFWHFRFDAHSEMKMEGITHYLQQDRKVKRVYIIGQDYAHGQQVAKAAREMLQRKRPDVKIVGDDLHPIGKVKDFAPYVAKMVAAKADTVITGSWGSDLSLLLKAAREAGLKAKFYTFYAASPGAPAAMGAAGDGTVLQLADWHINNASGEGLALALALRKRNPPSELYLPRGTTMIGMLAKAMEQARSTDPKLVALAMEDMRYKALNGEVWMRRADHQLIQPLNLSVFSKVDGKAVKYDSEGTGFGFKTVASLSARDTQMPTSCIMERP